MTDPHEPGDAGTSQVPARRAPASLRALVKLLDSAITIPGTDIRIGLDGLIGLIPGVGDAAGLLMSSLVVLAALRMGIPMSVAMRMGGNIIVEVVVGAVPVIGDLFDFVWKANEKNLALLEAHLEHPVETERGSLLTVGAVGVGVLAVTGGVLYGAVSLMNALWGLAFG
jgi:hypothetical protein